MFQFLHTADLHLDSPLRGLARREHASADAILGASRKAFENLIRLAIEEEVDFMVIAGDVYDRDWKDFETALFFRKGMHTLKEAGIRVYLISGNHDAASVITRKLSLPDNVKHFSSKEPETVEPEEWPVAVHGMSFPNRGVPENLVPRYPAPVPGRFNIGILHTSLAGAEVHDTYAPCSVNDLVAKGYDYWALGHIHQPAVVRENPWIVYPGNIQGRHIRECGERGCRIVTVGDDLEVLGCDWHRLDEIRWARVEVDVGGIDDFDELVGRIGERMDETVGENEERLLALRLELTGSTSLDAALRSRPDRIMAEAEARAEELGSEAVWLEKIRISTRPAISIEEMAKRDPLTKVVVEVVSEMPGDAPMPEEVTEMLKKLPPDLKETLAGQWSGEERRALLENACAIILDRLATKGDES
jgi:DNA repair exonuclease SbcCD nuclease subunit